MDNISVNTRSSIKITGTKTIYLDPVDLKGAPHDADLIFITHEHYDYFSIEDIKKVLKKDTQLVIPTHFGDHGVGELLKKALSPEIEVHIFW